MCDFPEEELAERLAWFEAARARAERSERVATAHGSLTQPLRLEPSATEA